MQHLICIEVLLPSSTFALALAVTPELLDDAPTGFAAMELQRQSAELTNAD